MRARLPGWSMSETLNRMNIQICTVSSTFDRWRSIFLARTLQPIGTGSEASSPMPYLQTYQFLCELLPKLETRPFAAELLQSLSELDVPLSKLLLQVYLATLLDYRTMLSPKDSPLLRTTSADVASSCVLSIDAFTSLVLGRFPVVGAAMRAPVLPNSPCDVVQIDVDARVAMLSRKVFFVFRFLEQLYSQVSASTYRLIFSCMCIEARFVLLS